jgi:hypothetical protein
VQADRETLNPTRHLDPEASTADRPPRAATRRRRPIDRRQRGVDRPRQAGIGSSRPDAPLRPATAFWPPADDHHIRCSALDVALDPGLTRITPRLTTLAALGDALRALQTLGGDVLHDAPAAALRAGSAEILTSLAASGPVTPEESEVLGLRARALAADRGYADAARREAAIAEPQPLTVICGPVSSWRQKTRAALHGVLASTQCRPGNALIADADRLADPALDELRGDLGLPELAIASRFPLIVDDLIVSGGEPSTFPKHFAYFMPEDEGVREATARKTVCFANVYSARHRLIGRGLARHALDPVPVEPGPGLRACLLLWLRGHDLGHAVRLPTTDYASWRRSVGHEPFMMLQETIADTFGFLLAASWAWRRLSPLGFATTCGVYLGELLQYLRRGPQLHGDAGAAYVELAFLHAHGFVDLAPDASRLAWSPDRLLDGMRALARALARDLLCVQGSARPSAFLARYAWTPRRCPPAAFTHRLRTATSHVPTSLAYRAPTAHPALASAAAAPTAP